MNDANELDALQAAWREARPAGAQGEDPPGLRKLVDRQTWLIRLHTAMELLISAAFLGASLWLAIAMPGPEFVVLAIAVWIITLTATIYSLWNRAGTWQPAAHDTHEFLQLSLRRCRAGLRAVTFGLYLLLAQVLLLASWHGWYWSGHSPVPGIQDWLLALCLPVVVLAVLLVLRTRGRRELDRLESMQRALFG
ncbi:MAG TPA: hypothetical protein VKJ01_01770 [Candidatus Solibacter sp.]|jgi:hypothetical protein|nr:hypothetical protein [Candidatus Solibacter sp.]